LLEPTFIKRLGKDSPTFANLFCSDSINSPTFAYLFCSDSPTFANLFCSDSINSLTFANLFCSDSPNSPTFTKGHFWKIETRIRHIRTSNLPFSRIWGEWPLLNLQLTQIPTKLLNFLKAKTDSTSNNPFYSTEIPFYEFDLDDETAAINISLTRLKGKNGNA
jgi:hypothetical protein